MQVRSRGSTGLADGTQGAPGGKPFTDSNVDRAQMAVHADEAAAMIDEYRLAVEEVIAGVDYRTCDRYPDLGTGRGGDVHAGVGIA